MIDVLDTLTGPGGPFEVVTDDVRGVPLQVYKSRLGSMRELVDMSNGRGDADFVVQDDRRLSYREHNARVRATASGLAARGVQRGDRVALLSANNPEWVVAFWACAAASAICVPLNAWWRAEELQFALEDSGSRVLICDERRWELVKHLPDVLPALEQVYVIGTDTPAAGAAPFTELEAGGDPGGFPSVDVDEDDIAGIFYTSGTTGKPKGATITHRQTLANLQNLFLLGTVQVMQGSAPPAELSGRAQAASLLIVPLFHTTGCHSTMVLNYASGGKLVLMPPGRFDPDAAMRLIQDERVTSIGGVPTVMWRLLESPDFGSYDLSSVTRISYGGAPSGAELVERITEAFPNVKAGLSTAYGLTETASVATAIGGDDYVAHPGSAGRAVPTVELRIVGPDGDDLSHGETGEVWIKGPTVSSHGYWNRPDANAESFTDGWFHTGDLGRLDAEGYLYIVDRAKDMVIRGGENIYSVEIENVLYEHPDVIDAAVVGVPHKTLGEEVKAVVQLKPGSTTSAADLQRFCAEHLAAYKVPAHLDLVTRPLPRNPAGKILKQALRGTTTSFGVEDASDSAL
ncbi:MAG: acyl--CoA ligase [Actinobacteria bacterium]|nr:MAG: acyl--CoA ligase [Actinomycetota bacterium]